MKTKIEIKSIFGDLLFSLEKEDNTIKDTLEEAIKAGVSLRNADLCNANLRNADLSYANLCYANLCYADLCDANLCSANLCYADLCDANLCNADLSYANLCYANLCYANLCSANLYSADLRNADLCNANLRNADLCYANLCSANLYSADLGDADLGDWGRLQSCTDVLFVTPIGSRNGCSIFFHTDKGIFVKCGCFSGTLKEFAEKVKETHGDNEHARDYLALVEFVKVRYNVDK